VQLLDLISHQPTPSLGGSRGLLGLVFRLISSRFYFCTLLIIYPFFAYVDDRFNARLGLHPYLVGLYTRLDAH